MEEKPLDILMVEDNLDHIELARRAFELAYSQDHFCLHDSQRSLALAAGSSR